MKHITRNFGFICTEIHCWYKDFLNYLILSDISTLGVTWWRLFQKRIVCTEFDIYVFIRQKNIWLHYFTLILPRAWEINWPPHIPGKPVPLRLRRWPPLQVTHTVGNESMKVLPDTPYLRHVLPVCIEDNSQSVPTVEWIPPVPIMSESQNKNIPFLSPYGTVCET
jgi:hypothetical protein